MFTNFILLAISIILVLTSLALLIAGAVNGKRSLWIPSLASLVIFMLTTIILIYISVNRSVNYAKENFKKASSGVVENLKENINKEDMEKIEKLAQKTADIVGSGIRTEIPKGTDTLTKATIYRDGTLEEAGIDLDRAEFAKDSSGTGYRLFLSFRKDFSDTLTLSAYDRSGSEQGVTKRPIKGDSDENHVVTFLFENREQVMKGYCILKVEDDQ